MKLVLLLWLGQAVFEVASVKPTPPQAKSFGIWTYRGGRVTADNVTFAKLVEEAFWVEDFQVIGGPPWARELRYSLDARPPLDSKAAERNPTSTKLPMSAEQRQMMQALLIERFQLRCHRETREGPVYLLTRTSSKKLKLTPSKDPNEYPWAGGPEGGAFSGAGVAGQNITMEQFARRLGPVFKKLVLDRTSLEGAFDFRVDYAPDDRDADVTALIVASVQQLGLKLEPAKGPVEMIVIDRAERLKDN